MFRKEIRGVTDSNRSLYRALDNLNYTFSSTSKKIESSFAQMSQIVGEHSRILHTRKSVVPPSTSSSCRQSDQFRYQEHPRTKQKPSVQGCQQTAHKEPSCVLPYNARDSPYHLPVAEFNQQWETAEEERRRCDKDQRYHPRCQV